jgi:hypothetical protein
MAIRRAEPQRSQTVMANTRLLAYSPTRLLTRPLAFRSIPGTLTPPRMTVSTAPSPRRRRKPEGPLPPNPFLVAAAAWALPGLGYWLIGARWRGLMAGITILLIYVFGLLIGGVRVIDVPGYDGLGYAYGTNPAVSGPASRFDPRQRVMPKPLTSAVFEKAWYIPQALVGPINIATSYASVQASRAGYVRSTAKLSDIGTLYSAVAGMLNLFILIDAAHRAAKARESDPRIAEKM